MSGEKYNHIFYQTPPTSKKFTSISARASEKRIPDCERLSHSQNLENKFNKAWNDVEEKSAVLEASREGCYIEFKSEQGFDLVIKSLEDLSSKKIRLLNVRTEGEGDRSETYATVYVAHDKKSYFLNKINQYAKEETRKGNPRHEKLINSIADIRSALLVQSFWQDDKSSIPHENPEWCEVWLRDHSKDTLSRFQNLLEKEEIKFKKGSISFPERIVKLILASKSELEKLILLSDDIAEYRLAKETSAFWLQLDNTEQAEWVEDCLARLNFNEKGKVSVCLLDTGVNREHPLLNRVLKSDDCHTVDPNWGIHDHSGHGTLMAGVASYGDLKEFLLSQDTKHIDHSLESVKILPSQNSEQTEKELWGYITSEAISRVIIQEPEKNRVLCMAITSPDSKDFGRPSSWSAALDQLVFGNDDSRNLFLVSAGNVRDLQGMINYPEEQKTKSVEDPAQAWNVITVGSYTDLTNIQDKTLENFYAIAPKEGLSPFTTTSLLWDKKWPIKPDIVFEGGNVAYNGREVYEDVDDLVLLSTDRDLTRRHFRGFNMTSASTAQAANFAAQIYSRYPNIWPETIRGLMVHSAQWTEELKRQFLSNPTRPSKSELLSLLRICGYGVPNLEKALYSANNSLVIVSEKEIQPFIKEGTNYKTFEMHLHELPWPKDVLLNLDPEIEIEMKVTLSYYIEPAPGEVGWNDRYRYASHGLRFDVKAPEEEMNDFIQRVNAAEREEDYSSNSNSSNRWTIGPNSRKIGGSVYSDIWSGTPTDLAEAGVVAVWPVVGWWKTRPHLDKYNQKTKYSLIISISTPEENIDIYTPVANQIGIKASVEI